MRRRPLTKAEAFEAACHVPLSPVEQMTLGDVLAQRFDRRDLLVGGLGAAIAATLFGDAAFAQGKSSKAKATAPPTTPLTTTDAFQFKELAAGYDQHHHVAEGYEARVVLRWGDPIHPGMTPFDPLKLDARDQERRFGYNNDYIAFIPKDGEPDAAYVCVNHEYTCPELMFPSVTVAQDEDVYVDMTPERVAIEMAAHGVSIIEFERKKGQWHPKLTGSANRRITASTPMTIDGPAAAHPRLKTAADPSGLKILGTFNNCAGGATPWGTYLTTEENFFGYFWTLERGPDLKRLTKGLGGAQEKSYRRYGLPGNFYNWGAYHDRFTVEREPNEPNRFGWVVEIDPSDPASTPVKHTALGRIAHEGAECVQNRDGRVVVYCGDDGEFEYVYRFVSKNAVKPGERAHNMRLLSEGTLSVARYNANGTVTWLPLVHGTGPLTPANGFASQAEVLIDARLAADKLGATRMDRPEDVQPHPENGKVWVMLTNNNDREPKDIDAANPRPKNAFGHIIEMTAPGADHAADTFRWDIVVRCGDPSVASVGAVFNPVTTRDGWFGMPDNCAVDADGRLWIATDGGSKTGASGRADGLYALETEGERRGQSKLFFRAPVGAEVTGPCFTPDGEALFLSVQHPGADGSENYPPFADRSSDFEDPSTRWPDFNPDMPPRPSILVITRKGGGRIARS